MKNRPDFSNLVAHFCKDAAPCVENQETEIPKTARDRLIGLLEAKRIYATKMPWTFRPASCFTECSFSSFHDHCEAYSAFGVGFTKAHLFASGGGPALYVKPDLFTKQKEDLGDGGIGNGIHPHLLSFMTPFIPGYAPKKYKDQHGFGKQVDYSHEREWRTPHDFTFEYDHVQFVILPNYEEMAKFPTKLKDEIGREKFITLDQFQLVERLWPTHQIEKPKR